MSLNRWAKKRDTAERPVIEALEKAGWAVFQELPCDLLCFKNGVWKTIEVKTAKNKRGDPRQDARQARQKAFLELTATPICVTPESALRAVGAI